MVPMLRLLRQKPAWHRFYTPSPVIQRDTAAQAGVCGLGWLTEPFQTPSKRGDLATPVFKQPRSTGRAVHSG
jgi:hypothetical protein